MLANAGLEAGACYLLFTHHNVNVATVKGVTANRCSRPMNGTVEGDGPDGPLRLDVACVNNWMLFYTGLLIAFAYARFICALSFIILHAAQVRTSVANTLRIVIFISYLCKFAALGGLVTEMTTDSWVYETPRYHLRTAVRVSAVLAVVFGVVGCREYARPWRRALDVVYAARQMSQRKLSELINAPGRQRPDGGEKSLQDLRRTIAKQNVDLWALRVLNYGLGLGLYFVSVCGRAAYFLAINIGGFVSGVSAEYTNDRRLASEVIVTTRELQRDMTSGTCDRTCHFLTNFSLVAFFGACSVGGTYIMYKAKSGDLLSDVVLAATHESKLPSYVAMLGLVTDVLTIFFYLLRLLLLLLVSRKMLLYVRTAKRGLTVEQKLEQVSEYRQKIARLLWEQGKRLTDFVEEVAGELEASAAEEGGSLSVGEADGEETSATTDPMMLAAETRFLSADAWAHIQQEIRVTSALAQAHRRMQDAEAEFRMAAKEFTVGVKSIGWMWTA